MATADVCQEVIAHLVGSTSDHICENLHVSQQLQQDALCTGERQGGMLRGHVHCPGDTSYTTNEALLCHFDGLFYRS